MSARGITAERAVLAVQQAAYRQRVRLLHPSRRSKYIPHEPTPTQSQFLALDAPEALFGGAAGGGKSDALLMAALEYVHVPGYAALLLRRTYADLALPGALMDRAAEWLGPTDAQWNGERHRWTFPSGATLNFGYMQTARDRERYQSAEFQFIGPDELTQFPENDYRFLFSRLRRRTDIDVPLRMRAATNPGGEGHDWVKSRFIDAGAVAPFVPSLLADNPFIDQEAYRASLAMLDDATRAQLEEGNWDVLPAGDLFQRSWFPIIEDLPVDASWVRYWDQASSTDGAWTAGAKVGRRPSGLFVVADMVRGRWQPTERDAVIDQTAHADGPTVPIWIEEERGSAGKSVIAYAVRRLAGFAVQGDRPTGEKPVRAQPFASQARAGNVRLLRGAWNSAYLNEVAAFPNGPYKDQVDSSSGAFNKLAPMRPAAGAVAGQQPYQNYRPR